ncbi:lytic transglycosylase domain-containing protein [Glacieibacterium sp.]|uniref:lytic transglycosylase domain-containing protein n=1 Tax=Glacieibacterium sp. TaxID=2860237 RepID=UPI003B00B95E
MLKAILLAAVAVLPFAAAAEDAAPSPDITVTGNVGITAAQRRVPAQLSVADRATYRQVFLDIEAGRYSAAEAALASLPDGLLTGTAKAQLMIARGTGRATLDQLNTWLTANADLPQTPKVLQLAQRLGTPLAPNLPVSHAFRTVSFTTPMNTRSAQGFGQPGDATLATRLKPLLAADRTADAESAWGGLASSASEPVATEWAQRTAWSYYIGGDDVGARRVGDLAAAGTGEWAALGGWVVGLASFRQGDCESAARGFDTVAKKFASEDLSAAAAYWASRAHMACGRPAEASARLTRAAAYPDSFYGLLARRALGLGGTQDWDEPDFITADWNHLSALPGARRAAALVEIGQLGLADRELKYLAATTDTRAYAPLLRLAARLTLPATQYWLAQHPPMGMDTPMSARFPAPDWRPYRGWRVDKNIVFAHALQESNFVTSATSRAGAKGIMQLMPSTAKLVSARMADGTEVQVAAVRDLSDPEFNIECGQTYLEQLRDMSYTAGLLPKVIAAYNAGPGSVQKWNTTLRDNGDPLLFIESIPFKETRHYVEVVMRNYWMYQLRDGQPVSSMDALVTGLWPKFPGMPGASGVRAASTYVAPPVPAYLAPQLPVDDVVVASVN